MADSSDDDMPYVPPTAFGGARTLTSSQREAVVAAAVTSRFTHGVKKVISVRKKAFGAKLQVHQKANSFLGVLLLCVAVVQVGLLVVDYYQAACSGQEYFCPRHVETGEVIGYQSSEVVITPRWWCRCSNSTRATVEKYGLERPYPLPGISVCPWYRNDFNYSITHYSGAAPPPNDVYNGVYRKIPGSAFKARDYTQMANVSLDQWFTPVLAFQMNCAIVQKHPNSNGVSRPFLFYDPGDTLQFGLNLTTPREEWYPSYVFHHWEISFLRFPLMYEDGGGVSFASDAIPIDSVAIAFISDDEFATIRLAERRASLSKRQDDATYPIVRLDLMPTVAQFGNTYEGGNETHVWRGVVVNVNAETLSIPVSISYVDAGFIEVFASLGGVLSLVMMIKGKLLGVTDLAIGLKPCSADCESCRKRCHEFAIADDETVEMTNMPTELRHRV